MVKTSFRKHRVAVLLAAFVTVSAIAAITAIAAIAASTRAAATEHGRALVGNFCTTSTGSMFCMTLTDDGVAYGTTNRAELALRPGTYWITLDDNSPAHDFALRSCPSSTAPCVIGNGTSEQETTPAFVGAKTIKINLEHGTYRLYCDVGNGFHESHGMYVDFEVGGVGQVG